MGDIDEVNRLLRKALEHNRQAKISYIQHYENAFALDEDKKCITDALANLGNIENKIKDVIADMDWRGLHNDAIILRRLKDIIPPRTSEEETERMKVRWPKKSPAKE